MTLPPVAFANDVSHAKGTVKTTPNKPIIPKTQKRLTIEFSDSDSGNDLPIPYLREEESEYSDEDFQANSRPTFIRKGFRRPIPRGANSQIRRSLTQQQFSLPNSRPPIPKQPAPPQNRPGFVRHIKTRSQLTAEQNAEKKEINSPQNTHETDNNNSDNSYEESSSEYSEQNTIPIDNNNETDQPMTSGSVSPVKSVPSFNNPDLFNTENDTNVNSPLADSSLLTSTEPVCYFLEKKFISKMMKHKVAFTLRKGSASIISVIVNTHSESVQMNYEDQLYTILMESSQNSFSLRLGQSYGDEIFSILYSVSIVPYRHKYCVLRFFKKIQNVPIRLQSQIPKLKANGELEVSFGNRQAIPSIKNMIFLNDKKEETLSIMKIAKTTLCIEVPPEIPATIVFIIGLSAFLNHTK